MKIILKGVPPSMNKFAGRKNEWAYRKEKKKWTELCIMPVYSKGRMEPRNMHL